MSLPRPALELLLGTAHLLLYVWVWNGSFPGHQYVMLGVFLAIALAGHVRRAEGPRAVGFRLDNAARAARALLPWVVAPVVVLPLLGTWWGTARIPSPWIWPGAIATGAAWGTLQQYALLGFYYRRFAELVPPPRASLLAAVAFALFHLPNPLLTALTLGAGVLACTVYRRAPNLLVIGLAHALVSLAISRSLPLEVTGGMRTGPGYLRFVGAIAGV